MLSLLFRMLLLIFSPSIRVYLNSAFANDSIDYSIDTDTSSVGNVDPSIGYGPPDGSLSSLIFAVGMREDLVILSSLRRFIFVVFLKLGWLKLVCVLSLLVLAPNGETTYAFNRKGRIVVGWHSDYVDCHILSCDAQTLHCRINDKSTLYVICVTFVYGCHTMGDRKSLWPWLLILHILLLVYGF